MKTQYRSPWDVKLIIITGLVITIFVSINIVAPIWYVALLLWSIILVSAAFGVYGYSIQNEKLKILRLGWSKDIKLSEIQDIQVKPNAMLGSFRRFGIGGLFGYIGYFSNSILGGYKAYSTHTKKTVLIKLQGEQIVVSPDDPEKFVATVKRKKDKTTI